MPASEPAGIAARCGYASFSWADAKLRFNLLQEGTGNSFGKRRGRVERALHRAAPW